MGDTGQLPKASPWLTPQRAVGDALAASHRARPADLLVLLGDNFYPNGLREDELEARVTENLVEPFCAFLDLSAPDSPRVEASCPLARSERHPIPLRAVLGNHDWREPASPALQQDAIPRYLANWRLRARELVVEETAAGVSVVLFDSTHGRSREELPRLSEALARSRGPWRVVASHHPILDTAGGELVGEAVAAAGVPVHLWLAGHDHNLQVSEPGGRGPGLQVIAGSGSHATGSRYEIPGRRFFRRALGYARVDLVPDPAAPGRELLSVGLVAVRRVPAALWQPAREVARYEIAPDASVRRVHQDASDPPGGESQEAEQEPYE